MEKTQIDITGMTCGHCAASVTKELSTVHGIHVLEVNPQTGTALVEGEANEQELVEAIDRAGYQATKFVKVND
ncbi:MAG: heavy-metal-associated domain-containing protein [Aquiluna sp.]|jgi:copper chaperone CopZ